MPIGKLEPVPLRELWAHEARGFSAWLADNIDALSEELGIALTDVRREQQQGAFPVDLLAKDQLGNRVIIENQLEPTDHDHLGKLITHLTQWDAKTAIWITKKARPEHVRAVQWLNEVSPEDVSFYVVRLAAYRIGDSEPAPQFTVIVGSVQESKAIGREKKELSEREHLYTEFWSQLKQCASDRGLTLHDGVTPGQKSWLYASAGYPNLFYLYWVSDKVGPVVRLEISGPRERNEQLFDVLHGQADAIEACLGTHLLWERRDGSKACYISWHLGKGFSVEQQDRWSSMQQSMVEAMARLTTCLKPYLDALPEPAPTRLAPSGSGEPAQEGE